MSDQTLSFRQGINGYAGTIDTQLIQAAPTTNHATTAVLGVDRSTDVQVLLRFDNLFGTNNAQIPAGAEIVSATLTLFTTNTGNGAQLHRMLTNWSDTSTWSSLGNGVQTNGVEAVATADVTTGFTSLGASSYDVTSSLKAWAGGAANLGWVFISQGTNGWDFYSAQGATPPQLQVVYRLPGPTNTLPVANADAVSVDEDGSATIAVLANDSDADGHALTVTGVGAPTHGVAVLNSDGTITYTPHANYHGTDSFNYTISDGHGGTASATVSVTVNPATPGNTAPVANADAIEVDEDAPVIIAVLSNDSDADGHTLMVTGVGTPTHGTAIVNLNGTITYTPNANYHGTDSFNYTISDGHGGTASAAVSVTVKPVNDLPIANTDVAEVQAGQSVIVPVLLNDTDVDGDILSVSGIATGPTHGSVVVNSDNTITYTPNAGYTGTDSFSYKISDGNGGTASASVNLTVKPALMPEQTLSFRQGINGYTGTIDTQLIQAAPTANHATTAILGVDRATDVQVLLRFDGLFGSNNAQIPADAEIVSATLTLFTTNTGNGAQLHRMLVNWSDASTWSSLGNGVQTNGIEAVATADVATGFTSLGASSYDVTSSVQAWAGGAANLGWVFISQGTNGWDFYSAQGTTPPQLQIVYRVPSPNNTLPVANADAVVINEDNSTTISVLGNDSDANGHPLTVIGVGAPTHGVAVLNSDGTITYTPNANYHGTDSFSYTISDGHGGTASANVSITINPVNDNPVANVDVAEVVSGQSVIVPVLLNDIDVDGDTLSVSGIATDPSHGTVAVNPDNTITYTPNAGYTGPDSFSYIVSDGNGGAAVAAVNLTIFSDDISAAYVATQLAGTSDSRMLEHTNSSKSFYYDGAWWAFLPNGANWMVHKFTGTPSEAGDMGGWQSASAGLFGATNQRRADIAWDPITGKLYVLGFSLNAAHVTTLYQLDFNDGTHNWQVSASVALTPSKLIGSQWVGNSELNLGLDQNGVPIITAIGAAGANQGLHLAYPTSSNLSTWSSTVIDPLTVNSSGTNGNSKVDIVLFSHEGVNKVGLIYSDDAIGGAEQWTFAWNNTPTNTTGYASGWTSEKVTDAVAIDNHMAAVSDGEFIYAVIKDDKNSIWLLKGKPGDWEPPQMVVEGGSVNPSRPTIVLDETNDQIYIFFQENTWTPYGAIYMKVADADNPIFNPDNLGQQIITGTDGSSFIDPQRPTHNVGDFTDDYFLLFAKSTAHNQVWYNDIQLGTDYLVA